MSSVYRVAMDGPSGAGKSTVAKKIAALLGLEYIDTGAMYRAVAYKAKKRGLDVSDSKAMEAMLAETEIDFVNGRILLDGEDVGGFIRTSEISRMASDVSALPEVRAKLVSAQREMGRTKSVIMDGRDIGTNVFPDAEYKFFLTASVEERALRRWKELVEKDPSITLETVREDIRKRDYNDSHRKLNPLCMAEDAIEVDSTGMDIEQVVTFILDKIRNGEKKREQKKA